MLPFNIAFSEAPATWRRLPLSAVVAQRKCKNSGLTEQNLLSLSYGRIIRKNIDSADGLLPESFDGYNVVEPDDVVLRFTDLQNDKRSLRTGQVLERGIITSAYLTVTPKVGFNPRFVYYLLHGLDLMKLFYTMGDGLRQSVVFDDFKRIPVAAPAFEVQTAIADYLDRKTAAIDALIAKKELLIEELRKYQEAAIAEAVAPRDGWTGCKVKNLVRPLPKSNRPAGDADDAGDTVFYVSGQQVKRCYRADWTNAEAVVLATGGLPAIHFADGNFSYSSDCWALQATPQINTTYLWLWLLSQKEAIAEEGFRGAGIKHLDKSWLMNRELILPPLPEQEAIARQLTAKRQNVLNVIEACQAVIDDLTRLRAALIAEAVTGKVRSPLAMDSAQEYKPS